MRFITYLAGLALILALSNGEESSGWSWGGDQKKEQTPEASNESTAAPATDGNADAKNSEEVIQPRSKSNIESDIDQVVEEILASTRQGRNLDGYDDVYSDPNVQQVLQNGDDGEARNVIRDKLCYLGLMQCDEVDPKRPYISPENLIYAQPVALKPYGRPIPSVPLRGPPRGAYGPPKAMPFPPHVGGPVFSSNRQGYGPPKPGPYRPFGPPKEFSAGPIYSATPPPSYSGSQFQSSQFSQSSSFNRPQIGHKYEISEVDTSPYEFQGGAFTSDLKKPSFVSSSGLNSGSLNSDGGVQKHVHHHFHHNADASEQKVPTVIVNNPGLPSSFLDTNNGLNSISSSNGFNQISSGYGSIKQYKDIKDFSGVNSLNGYKGVNAGLGSAAGSNGIYGTGLKPSLGFSGSSGYGGSAGTSGLSSFDSGNNFNIGSNSYSSGGFNSNSYGGQGASSTFYKKEIDIRGPSYASQLNGGGLYQNNYQANNGLDCVCVPFNQCPAPDVLGRKDDLLLPIDPRNLGSNIEALPDDLVITDGNGTMTVVRVTKEADNSTDVSGEPKKISKRAAAQDKQDTSSGDKKVEARQAGYFNGLQQCGPQQVCCRRPRQQQFQQGRAQCGVRNSQGINGRIKNPVYVDGDSEFGEYPWQAAILKKDPKESVYVCGGTLIDHQHIITAAHCIKTYTGFDLRVRLGEWDVNHDVEFYPYIERDVISVHVHPEYYAGTLDNDLAVLKLNQPVDWTRTPHISPACLPERHSDFTGARCWTTGWGKDAFGDFGKYQNILKEVDVPVIGDAQCQAQLRQTRLGYNYRLNPGFLCAGGEEGKDACKGDGGGPLVCERGGVWHVAGVVSWGIGCGQPNVPGVYVKVSHYIDWINQIIGRY